MNKIALTILLLFSSHWSYSQVNLDSLYAVWQDETLDDSIRATAFTDYIWEGYISTQPDSAFVLAETLLAFVKDKNYPRFEASAYIMQGTSWKLKGNYIKALNYYSQSLAIREKIGDQRGIANSLYNIGRIYDDQGKDSKALDNFIQCLDYYEQVGDQNGLSLIFNYIGGIYYKQGDYTKARKYYAEGLVLDEQLKDKLGIAIAYSNIGNTLRAQKEYFKARDYYNRALEIAKELGLQFGISANLGLIGANYQSQGDFPKALDYFTQSLEIYEEIGVQDRKAYTLNSIGEIYHAQGDFSKALVYCQKGYKLAVSTSDLMGQKEGCQCLYDTYKAIGEGNKALLYIEKIQVIDDSINAEETAKKLQQMEFQKEMLADSIAKAEEARLVKEAHEEEMRAEEKTRNGLLVGGVFLLFLAGGIYSRLRYIRKAKAAVEHEKDRSENLLLNILPAEIAEELKEKGKAEARDFEQVSVLFTDFKGFTELSARLSAADLVKEINHCFEAFDGIMEKFNIEKIKTIGDAYMAAGGLPVTKKDSVKNTVLAALEMQDFVTRRRVELEAQNKPAFAMRVGVHTGPVVAGIVGVKKFQYDIWGDTVNTASRMESSGEIGKVNISQTTYNELKEDPLFTFESRGMIEAKGKGEIGMWFVSLKPDKENIIYKGK